MERLTTNHEEPLLLVTGAGGFLGKRLAKHLCTLHSHRVRVTVRQVQQAVVLREAGCDVHIGELTDPEFCARVTSGVDSIIHCAALSRPLGSYDEFHAANVIATQTLVHAAIAAGCRQWVNIGTPSIYATTVDRYRVTEADPLPERMINHYAATKYQAESHILQLNGKGIRTISLRPRAIIGGGDTVIMPRLLAAQKAGRLRVIGSGTNVVDLTNVRNVIEAVMCALHAPADAWGAAYNITNGEPVMLWQAIRDVLLGLGLQPSTRRIPRRVAYAAAATLEAIHGLLKRPGEPIITRYGVHVLASSMTLDITAARTKLGYKPLQNTAEGIQEFCSWYAAEVS